MGFSKRILAALVAMAGLGAFPSPLTGEDGSAGRGGAAAVTSPLWGGRAEGAGGGDCDAAISTPGQAACLARPADAHKGELARLSLPRHLHRAVATLLRPAESAARRLIIVLARDLVVPPPRPRKPGKAAEMAKRMAEHHAVMRRYGLAVVVPAELAAKMMKKQQAAKPLRIPSLPLLDPLPNLFRRRRKTVPNHLAPRIRSLDWNDPTPPRPLPPPPSPDDPVDATRLGLRLAALSRALDDLPAQARRFARVSVLRPGPAHGWRRPYSRRKPHEIDEVLADLHHFAFHALQRRDTS